MADADGNLRRIVLRAARRRPRIRDWAEAVALLAAFGLVGGGFGIASGLLVPAPPPPLPVLLLTALVALAVPALGEEAVFRGPLDAGAWRPRAWIAAAVGLAAFVAWHPLQIVLRLPWAQPDFADPRFLALAALLGAACTASRMRSGSLWPPVAIHWAAAVSWKALFGG